MQGLTLALASVTAAASPILSTTSTAPCAVYSYPFIQGLHPEVRANSSRPDRVPGEFVMARYISQSSGSLSIGDFAASEKKSYSALMADFMLGAALVLQEKQTAMDHEIQAFVSSNFETYWD